MIITLIQKSIIPLFVATLLLGGFFWQFTMLYGSIIEHFTEDKLYVIYSHLIIYTFLSFTWMLSIIHSLNHLFFKSKTFIAVPLASILIFYTLSYNIFYNLFLYFVEFPLSENALMGLVLFIVTTFGYALYSLLLLFFNKFVPIMHVLIFTLLETVYSLLFINQECYSILDMFNKL